METEPPQPNLLLLLALLPALLAAAYSVASSTLAYLSPARKAALRDSAQNGAQQALARYLKAPARIEARWLVIRVGGVAATAALVSDGLSKDIPLHWLIGLLSSVLCYAIPSEVGRKFAHSRAERLAPRLLRVLRPGEWLVAPLADPVSWIAGRLVSDVSSRPPSATLTETEVELIVNEGELNGSLAHDQSEMIRNVLDFADVTAEQVMIPRIHVHALDSTAPTAAILREVTDTKHSRYPVFDGHIDNIIGVLHVKDLLSAMALEPSKPIAITTLSRHPVAFVPESQLASTVLKDMRAGRHHLAVVVDEFGGFSGIVTLEDLLEEIVGDIQDEHDLEDLERIRLLDNGHALVDASLPVTDINRHLGTELPEGDYVSLGGLLLDMLGSVPAAGTRHEVLGLSVTVRESDARRVALVELSGLPRSPTDPEGPPAPKSRDAA